MTKISACCALYLCNLCLLCTCEKGNISFFFQFLIFVASSGVKGQKMTQNDRKLCGCTHISVIIHHMMVIFWYTYIKWWHRHRLWFSGVKGQKIVQKYKKSVCLTLSQKPHYLIWFWFLVHMCKMIYPVIFSFFQNSDFFMCLFLF